MFEWLARLWGDKQETVSCPCGQSYRIADLKLGDEFACHCSRKFTLSYTQHPGGTEYVVVEIPRP